MAPESRRIRVISYAGIVLTGIYLGVHSYLATREKKEEAALLRSLSSLNVEKNRPTAEESAVEAHAEKGPQAAETGTTAPAKPASRSGPFGLAAGMTLAELQAIGKVENRRWKNWYRIVPPKPDPAFNEYLLKAGRTTGLCKIGALGVLIRTSPSGEELKAAFDRMDKSLQAKYGPRDKRELAKAGRTWDASTEWMVGLLKKELTYTSLWGGDEVPLKKKTDRIDWLALDAHAESLEEGYVGLTFGFDNLEKCEQEDEQEKNEEPNSRVVDPTERSTPGH